MPAGAAPTNPEIPPKSCSFEFASTSASSPRITVGTTAALAIWYVLASTSMANASGKSSRLSDDAAGIITIAMPARAAIDPMITDRWPPRTRSTSGPMNGPTRANGAMVSTRPSSTFWRPSAGSTSKNRVLASARASDASPAMPNPCVIARRANGVSRLADGTRPS